MGMRRYLSLLGLAAWLLPATAQASVVHTVAPGETLWQLAADEQHDDALVRRRERPVARCPDRRGHDDPDPVGRRGGRARSASRTRAGTPPRPRRRSRWAATPSAPGDTLSAIAATGAACPLSAIAPMNGLDPDGPAARRAPCSSCRPARPRPPAPRSRAPATTQRAAGRARTPRSGRVTSADIAAVASRNGVPASLASAIAWQETGFNNAMVSTANARGVMQVMPGTWD